MQNNHNIVPFFSVIIPSFNRAHILPRAIQSVFDQVFTQWELIIVDDGSTDDTLTVVQAYQSDNRIKYIRQENKGVCTARNFGSEKAMGTYLVFLDSDDTVTPTWLMDFYDEIQKSNADIVKCNTIVNNKQEEKNYNLLAGNFTVKKDFFIAAGKYDENLKFGENTELIWRLNERNPKIVRVSNYNFLYDNDLINNSIQKKENQVVFTYYVLKKHESMFKKNKRWTQLVYQIAGVNCMELGRAEEGKKLIWKGYFCNPKHVKSLFRAIRYSITNK